MMDKAAAVHFSGAQASTLRKSLPHIDDDHRNAMFHELAQSDLPDDTDVASSPTLPDDVLDAANNLEHQGGTNHGSSS